MEQLKILGAQLLAIWSQLGVNQKLTVAASGLLVAATLAVVVFFTSRTDFVLLYGGLAPKDAGDVVAHLEEQSIEYEAGAGGTSIKVPRDKVHSLRMTLARLGLPKSSGDGKGYELFDEKEGDGSGSPAVDLARGREGVLDEARVGYGDPTP